MNITIIDLCLTALHGMAKPDMTTTELIIAHYLTESGLAHWERVVNKEDSDIVEFYLVKIK